jgi:ABC-2 type transport system permease protein
MIIFWNNLKRIFKKPTVILFMIVVPVMFIVLITGFSAGEVNSGLVVGIVDNDDTVFTEKLIENVRKTIDVKIIDESMIQNEILDQRVVTVLVLDEGLTKNLINGDKFNVKSITLDNTNMSYPVKIEINNYLNAASIIAKNDLGNEENFYKVFEKYNKQIFTSKINNIKEESSNKDLIRTQIGFLVMSMLFMSTFATSIITKDKFDKIYYRV